MNNRSIGRLILIKNSVIIAEIYNGIDNQINTLDGTRFVGEIGTYVSIYELGRILIAEVLSVESSQHLSNVPLAKPNANRVITMKMIGEIIGDEFYFGVSKMPLLYSEVHVVTNQELDTMLAIENSEVKVIENKTRITSFTLGNSVLFPEYEVKVNLDNFFGYHTAIFGNTGAGKSNTIAKIIQNIYIKKDFSAVGSRIIIIDSNGEYKKSFAEINQKNNDIKVSNIEPLAEKDNMEVPIWMLSVDDWAILLHASEKTQIPVLRKAMEVIKIFNAEENSKSAKNHMLALTIIGLLNNSESPSSVSDKITTLLTNFGTEDIGLNSNNIIKRSIGIKYGQMEDVEECIKYLQPYINPTVMEKFRGSHRVKYSLEEFFDAMKFAVLYEGSLNSQRVQEYTAPLISRMQSLVESPFKDIFKKTEYVDQEDFFKNFIDKCNLINIDVSSMDDSMAEVLIRVLSKIILDYQKTHINKAEKPINLIIEEAHRYIKENIAVSNSYEFDIFQRIAKEGRKYGFLMCVSSQRPSDLSKTVVSQCSNFIVHRIQNPDDLSYISKMVPYIDKDTIDRLTYLQTGNALVFGSATRIPMLTAFEEAIPNTDGRSAKISEKWYSDSPN